MRILILAGHPDDAEIGCGGVILQHVAKGDEVELLLMTNGELGCPGLDPEVIGKVRLHEAFEACEFTGAKIVDYWSYPDGGLPVNQETITRLRVFLKEHDYQVVYSPYDYDSHADHRAVTQILKGVLHELPKWPLIFLYEIWTPLPVFDTKVDITPEIGNKLIAIRRHESQVARIRFDEAALSLARFRGELHNRPNGPYAEVFSRLIK